MALHEREYIQACKEQIERKFAFGNGKGYTQRDLESLGRHVEEKTGITLSLSTLKRLWRGDFKERPQVATLNALAEILDYKDWQDFKLKNKPVSKRFTAKGSRPWIIMALFLLISAIIIGINMPGKEMGSGKRTDPDHPKITGPVRFSAQKTVTSGIPNTVVFNYDLSHVEADSFFIQQSWNEFHKAAIDPKGNFYSSIYFESGYHRAKLIANDSVIALQPVHILSDGWEPHIYYSYLDKEPITFKNASFRGNGQLHLSKELLLTRNVDFSRPFFSRITNSREFNVSSGNFSLVSRMKVDSIAEKLCPWMRVIVVTEKHIFWINLQNKGCERNAGYKTGEVVRYGGNNDLSALGVDPYAWQEVGITVKNKHAEISINGEIAFRETFMENFGHIKGLIFLFDGTGSLDYVRLADENGRTVFEDDF